MPSPAGGREDISGPQHAIVQPQTAATDTSGQAADAGRPLPVTAATTAAAREDPHTAGLLSYAGASSTGRNPPRGAIADLLSTLDGRFLAADVPALAQLVRGCTWDAPVLLL